MTEAIWLSNPSTGISTVQHSKYNKSLSFIRDFILERDYTLVTSSDLFIREFIQERNHTNSVALHPSGKQFEQQRNYIAATTVRTGFHVQKAIESPNSVILIKLYSCDYCEKINKKNPQTLK
uniref:Uncharacterized protein n=1 Tax=Amphiprion ocellaris TaxID=80972 RepID=A0AAQ6AM79_AMPOC